MADDSEFESFRGPADGVPHDAGDSGQALQGLHSQHVPMLQSDVPPLHLDLAQLPVEALLSALNRKPEAELREASGRLTALGAKVGAKVVGLRQGRACSPDKGKVMLDARSACVQCRRQHLKCDSQKPCERCIEKSWAQECTFDDIAVVPLPKVPRVRKKPPVQKAGYGTSGDKLCGHNLEKRYCLHPICVAQGGGKAMCKHGKRKRSCTEPDCVNEMEERRRQIQQGRCKHGVQMRCCTQEECRIDFTVANQQYREKLKERKRLLSGEQSDASIKPKGNRGSAPEPGIIGPAQVGCAQGHDDADAGDKASDAAAVIGLSCPDSAASSLPPPGGQLGIAKDAAPSADGVLPLPLPSDIGEHVHRAQDPPHDMDKAAAAEVSLGQEPLGHAGHATSSVLTPVRCYVLGEVAPHLEDHQAAPDDPCEGMVAAPEHPGSDQVDQLQDSTSRVSTELCSLVEHQDRGR